MVVEADDLSVKRAFWFSSNWLRRGLASETKKGSEVINGNSGGSGPFNAVGDGSEIRLF